MRYTASYMHSRYIITSYSQILIIFRIIFSLLNIIDVEINYNQHCCNNYSVLTRHFYKLEYALNLPNIIYKH